ncbi:hypothetical protein E4U58_001298, partial [Claviceps cyperi]
MAYSSIRSGFSGAICDVEQQQQQQHRPRRDSLRHRPKNRNKTKKQNRSTRTPPPAMAHDAQSAGAAIGAVPMDIDSGTRGLDQSCHHPLSGLGGTNVEAVTPQAFTARERVPKHLKADYERIASL